MPSDRYRYAEEKLNGFVEVRWQDLTIGNIRNRCKIFITLLFFILSYT